MLDGPQQRWVCMTRAPDLADTLRAIAFRVTTENVSANLGYKFGQDEETYNMVA